MSTTFVITSTRHEATLKYTYNKAGLLTGFLIEGEIEEGKIKAIIQHLPLSLPQFQSLIAERKKSGTLKSITEIKETFDFEKFYQAYPRKVGKAEAQKAFAKLKEHEQARAIQYLMTYKKKCDKDTVSYLYPATYLNQRRWEDE